MDKDINRKIEAYLGGDMTSDQVKEFELMMSKDIGLQKEVQLSNEINHHLNNENWLSDIETKDGEVKQDLEDYMKSDEAGMMKSKIKFANQRYKSRQRRLISKSWMTRIAAIFIIGLLTTVLIYQNSSKDLYTKYYSENDLPSLVKRGVQNEFLKNGIIAFKAKKYENAIAFFESYSKESNDPLIYSYIGISYLEMGDSDKALNNFDKLLNSNSLDKSKALWYKSLMYLKMDNTDELKKTLSEIISDSTNFNYEKAEELLFVID